MFNVVLFVLIFVATLSRGQNSPKYLCYKSQVLQRFRSPSDFGWTDWNSSFITTFNSEQCFRICSDHFMPYSALSLDNHCLCAYNEQENSIQDDQPVEHTFCKKHQEDYITVYVSNLFSKISNIQIKVSPEFAMVDEDFTFELKLDTFDKKVDMQFSIDFGDDNEFRNWTSSAIFNHSYQAFSYYEVKIMGREVTNPQEIFILASKTIQVVENITYSDVILACASLITPFQDPQCNVTILVGQNMNGVVDFGDNTKLSTFKIPDVRYSPFGARLPLPPIELTSENLMNKLFFIDQAATSLQREGAIRAIKGYARYAGSFEVIIYRPFCGNNVECLDSSTLCSPPLVYCIKNQSCIEPNFKRRFTDPFDCKLSTLFFDQYKMIRRVRIHIKETGYFFLMLSHYREYKAGDLVAIKSNITEVASWIAKKNETPDSYIYLDSVDKDPPKMFKFSQLNQSKVKLMVRVISYENTQFKLHHNYTENGNYEVNFTLKSPWAASDYSYSANIIVQTPIGQLSMHTVLWAKVNEYVPVGVSLKNGSDVHLFWSFGNGLVADYNISLVQTHDIYTKGISYFNPGVYEVLVRAENLHNKRQAKHILTIQHPVTDDWHFKTNSPQLLPGNVTFTLSLNLTNFGKGKFLPTNGTATFSFGDNQTLNWTIPNSIKHFEAGLIKIDHKYQKPGKYLAKVSLSNFVSSITLHANVHIMQKIIDFKVETNFEQTKGRQVKSADLEMIKVATNSPINFTFSLSNGDVEKYVMYVDGKVFKESKQEMFSFSSETTGWHNLTFLAYNPIQGTSNKIQKRVYFMKPYSNFNITHLTNDTTAHLSSKNFSVSFDDIGTDVCLIVDFGDNQTNSSIQAFGNKNTCSDLFSNLSYKYIHELKRKFVLNYHYPKPGQYVLKTLIGNHVTGKAVSSQLVKIVEIHCKPSIIEIINSRKNVSNSIVIWQSKPVKLYARTKVDCNQSVTVKKYWEAFSVNPETNQLIENVDLSWLDSREKTLLYIHPFTFKTGHFKFRFVINITSSASKPFINFHNYAETFVKIVPSPIIGRMTKGAETRVIRGYGQRLLLSPATESFDPDDKNNKNFSITWFCRRLPYEKIDRSLHDKDQLLTNPFRPRGSNEPDLGGCFGQGPGIIDTKNGSINWTTSLFSKPGNYEILIRIDPLDRDPSWAGIQLVLLNRHPPSITVECQTTALCYPHVPIGQTINPLRVGLIGLCSEACEDQLKYKWSIYGIEENGKEIHLSEAKHYVVGINEPKMALDSEFFRKYYPLYGDFFAKLSVTNRHGDVGESDIFLHINQPPIGGVCTFNMSGNLAMIDKHVISCKDWYDPENKPIESYSFWIRNKRTGIHSLLFYGPEANITLVLPYGDYVIGADIKDYEDGMTRVEISNVTMLAPTHQQYNNFIDSGILKNLNQAGDQVLMNVVSQAISSLMDVQLEDNKSKISKRSLNKPYHHKSLEDSEKETKTKTEILQFVDNIMNVDSLTSLEQIGSVLTAIAGKGKNIDNKGKDIIVRLLEKTINMASTVELESPQQLLDFVLYSVGTMGSVVTRMSEQLIKKKVLPSDQATAWDIEYMVEPADYGEERDYVFDGKSSLSESLSKIVIESEKRKIEKQIKQMIDLTIKLVLSILKHIVVGEKPLEISAPSGLSMTIEMFNGGSLTNKTIKHKDALYMFPDVCSILVSKKPCHGNETLGLMAVSWPAILESFGAEVNLLSSSTKTLQLLLLDDKLNIIDVRDTKKPFLIVIPRETDEKDELHNENDFPTLILPELKFYENMVYHQFEVRNAYSVVNIELTLTNLKSNIVVFFSYQYKPVYDNYELFIPLSAIKDKLIGNTYHIFLNHTIIKNRVGFFYIGIATINQTMLNKHHSSGLLSEIIINSNATLTNTSTIPAVPSPEWFGRTFNTNYYLQTYTSGCYFFDYQSMNWTGKGCYVHKANRKTTDCKCNHLTSFGSGFFVAPNTIDFSYVFVNAGFIDNVTIYMAVIVSLLFFALLLIWARWRDKLDLKKLGASPLPDNDPSDKYLYEIIVYTGEKEDSGTDSIVNFILSGDDDETNVRVLADPKRLIFRKGGEDRFVMAVPRKLGNLTYLRIWHDNSGKGVKRSWFLSFVVVKDVQTGEQYEFICNKWFAVEKGDGSINRLIPVTGLKEALKFSHLFRQKTRNNLKDDHLWFSIFMRPPRSRFTRLQRVACAMSLLYLSMLVNAMWYERVSPKPKYSALEIGPFALSAEQIGIGFMSNLIVFPLIFLIILLFRKSRLRKLRPSRLEEAAKKQGLVNNEDNNNCTNHGPAKNSIKKVKINNSMLTKSKSKLKNKWPKKRKTFLLPWWCRYVAWFLCIASIVVSIFFLWAYAIQFGEEKIRKWITSLFVSIFTSILITQPIKIFFTAIILSTILKSPIENDDIEEDEEEIDLDLAQDEMLLHSSNKNPKKAKLYQAPDLKALERVKLERMKEIKMAQVLKEIFSYISFLWIMIVLTYGNRDPNAFLIKDTIKRSFIEGANSKVPFHSVVTTDQFWNYINQTLIPGLLVGPWYNGYQPYTLRGFINDRVNRIMGYGMMRQVRIKNETCNTADAMKRFLSPDQFKCREFANLIYESKRSYTEGWKTPSLESNLKNKTNFVPFASFDNVEEEIEKDILTKIEKEDIVLLHPSKSKKTPWQYRKPSELNGLPFLGKLDVYSGGGYTIALRGSRSKLREKILKLKNEDWIDAQTRAVFVEFSTYNPHVNLFAIVSIVAEFQPGGGIVPNHRIDVVRLIRYHQGFGLFILLCELTYVSFLIYFTIREFKNWKREGRDYLKSYWNWAELLIITLSYIDIALYIYRLIVTHQILKIFNRTHGNGYVKLQFVATLDEAFGYIMAIINFIAIIKFIRLFRFNKRMGLLYSTLDQCSQDLRSFGIVFFIVFLAFVQMFYLIFGNNLRDFSLFIYAMESTFGMVTGKFDFQQMNQAAPILGPISFFIFILIAQIILINIFLTLIISAFETVKHDIMKQNNEFEIVEFIIKQLKEILGFSDLDSSERNLDLSKENSSFQDTLKYLPNKVGQLLEFFVSAKNSVNGDGHIDRYQQSLAPRLFNGNHNYFKSLINQRSLSIDDVRQRFILFDTFKRRKSSSRQASLIREQSIKSTVFDWIEINDFD